MKRFLLILAALFAGGAAYLAFAPGPIDPVAWEAPENRGLIGAFAPNGALSGAEPIEIGGHTGPEDVVEGPDGALYTATHESAVLKIDADGAVTTLFETGGRPLGLAIAPDGTLYVADAYLGLLRWSDGALETLVDEVDGAPLRYANSVSVASDGVVYFTQSTRRFDPVALRSTLEASVRDISEHRLTGRLLVWRPETGAAETVAEGFNFANGVALSEDESFLILAETGYYRLWRIELAGPDRGARTVLIDNLPAFPDNVKRDPSGDLFWVGMGSLRRPILDNFSGWPSLRAAVFKLPTAVRPKPHLHGIVFAVDANGAVQAALHDPSGALGFVSGATAAGGSVIVALLKGDRLYRVQRPQGLN